MAKAIPNKRPDHWQGAEKLNIWSASNMYVIPESDAGGCPESRKKQYVTGYRISSAVGGLVRYDDCGGLVVLIHEFGEFVKNAR